MMTIESKLENMAEAKEQAKEDLKQQWNCDSVEIGENTIVLNWAKSVERPGDNTQKLSEKLTSVAKLNPNAQVQCFADSERFTIQIQVN